MNYTLTEIPDDSKVERELRRVGDAMRVPVLYIYHNPPTKPVDGMLVICDGDDWDPLVDGIKRPLWYDAVAGVWKKFE